MNFRSEKVVSPRKKRLGRGYGSGKGGHASGRGQKGQKTRKNLGILFEGVKVKKSLIKRLPFLRGKNKFKAKVKPVEIDLARLNAVSAGAKVDLSLLINLGLVSKKEADRGVKIVGNTKLTKKLTVELPTSKGASSEIVKAGGKVV